MNQKIFFSIIGIMIIVGGGYYLFNNQSTLQISPSDQLNIEYSTPLADTNTDEEVITEEGDSRYLPYSYAAFMSTSHKKRVLYFHADWCPVCRPLDQELTQKMDEIPPDVVIFKVNYDKEVELKKQHAITYQHTFVQLESSGTEVARWSGGSLADILDNIK